jgi:hypothetical protein
MACVRVRWGDLQYTGAVHLAGGDERQRGGEVLHVEDAIDACDRDEVRDGE